VALFARGARGVTLTPAGDRLHPAAVKALSLVLDAARELRRRKGGAIGREPVRISVTPSFAVRYAAAIDQPGLESTLWLREELVPVGAPSLLNGRGRTPAELIRLPLLHDSSEAFWRCWFAAADLPDHPEPTGAIFNDYNLAVGAAVSDLGLLLGRTGLLDQELGDGRLIEATELRAPSPRAYHLVRQAGVLKPAAAALWDWLLPQGN
jgi:DNA-binding transcriptional LysR family regulator